MFTGARKVAPSGGLVMRTTGGRFVGVGGGPGWTGMLTGAERVEAPSLSVALAVRNTLVPGGTLLQTRTNVLEGGMGRPEDVAPTLAGRMRGELVTTPKLTLLAKNSTCFTMPSRS